MRAPYYSYLSYSWWITTPFLHLILAVKLWFQLRLTVNVLPVDSFTSLDSPANDPLTHTWVLQLWSYPSVIPANLKVVINEDCAVAATVIIMNKANQKEAFISSCFCSFVNGSKIIEMGKRDLSLFTN